MTRKTRRKILKASPLLLGGTGLATNGSAAPLNSNNEYVGVTYNPRTQEILGEASGKFTSLQDELVGNIDLKGLSLPVNQTVNKRHVSASGSEATKRFFVKKTSKEFLHEEKPLRVVVSNREGGDISGIADYGIGSPKKAFRLRPNRKSSSRQSIIDNVGERISGGG